MEKQMEKSMLKDTILTPMYHPMYGGWGITTVDKPGGKAAYPFEF